LHGFLRAEAVRLRAGNRWVVLSQTPGLTQPQYSGDTICAMSNGRAALLADLHRIVRDPARRVFALADGARFDDLPGALTEAGISGRSLYQNVQDAELVRAGPWLIDPYRLTDAGMNAWGGFPFEAQAGDEGFIAADTRSALSELPHPASFDGAAPEADPARQLDALIQLVGDAPAAVFWIGGAGLSEPVLWRHLRTLNMVLIPKEYDAPDTLPRGEGEETHDALMFRHADGNVLAEVLPVLDPAQFSRIFGPAKALMFLAPDHPGSDGSPLRRAVLPDDAPPAQPGLLKLSMEQMRGIEGIRFERSRLRITRYLRNVAPEQAGRLGDAELSQSTARWMEEAQGHGVKSEAALGRWTYLQLITIGEIGKRKEVTDYLKQGNAGHTADQRVQDLMHMAAFRIAGG
jgi:hypothetical protein